MGLHEVQLHVEARAAASIDGDLEAGRLDHFLETLERVVGEIGALRTGEEADHRRGGISLVVYSTRLVYVLTSSETLIDEVYIEAFGRQYSKKQRATGPNSRPANRDWAAAAPRGAHSPGLWAFYP
jgi:hypothetical protein